MSDAGGATLPAASGENQTPDEALIPHRRFSAAPHINSMCSR
jgi:hypothetical protein